jgi:hypothetical protein
VIGPICGAFFGLQCVAREVLEGETQRFDEAVLLALRHGGDPGTRSDRPGSLASPKT